MELIFVHGALVRDGLWWWHHTAELLEAGTGMHSRVLALPSCGETGPEEVAGGLRADAGALRRELDLVDSAIVVGHSYGGTVIAEAGQHRAVAHLVYVSSYLPDVGESQSTIMSGESDPVSVADTGNGTLAVAGFDVHSFGARFLQDADDATQHQAWERITPQAIAAFTTPTSAAGWHGIDSTYLVCQHDRSTSLGLQRLHAQRATRAVELPTDHHPFVSRPELVVEQIQAVVRT
jgi:pimeloyl-ACP methyl ester carboxylesterase